MLNAVTYLVGQSVSRSISQSVGRPDSQLTKRTTTSNPLNFTAFQIRPAVFWFTERFRRLTRFGLTCFCQI